MENSVSQIASATAMPAQDIDFEGAMKELEIVVSELDGEVKLEKALSLFEQGMKLSKQCEDFLKGAEQRIELLKRGEDGALVAVAVVGDNVEAIAVAGVAAAAAARVDKADRSTNAEKAPSAGKRKKVATTTDSDDSIIAETDYATSQLSIIDAFVKS